PASPCCACLFRGCARRASLAEDRLRAGPEVAEEAVAERRPRLGLGAGLSSNVRSCTRTVSDRNNREPHRKVGMSSETHRASLDRWARIDVANTLELAVLPPDDFVGHDT